MATKETDFDILAGSYDASIALFNSLDDWVYLKNLPKSRRRVLDIGCGSGQLLRTISPYFGGLYGIDNSKKMVNFARLKNSRFKIVLGDATELPYQSNYFDYVVSHTAFHHFDIAKATKEVQRVLVDGGQFVVDVTKDGNILLRKTQKLIFRYCWSIPRLVYKFGISQAINIFRVSSGPKWKKHKVSEQSKYLSPGDFRKIYSRLLPGARYGIANYSLSYLVWHK